MYDRWYADALRRKLARPFVHLVFGARQTGKSTLLRSVLPEPSLAYDLSDPRERSLFIASPGAFLDACLALPARRAPHVVFVDEAQAAPAVFDAVQRLYDLNRTRWRFILCGSSARKLRATGVNLLPGRSFLHRLYPLTLTEQPAAAPGDGPAGRGRRDRAAGTKGATRSSSVASAASPLKLPWPRAMTEPRAFPSWDIEERLAFGSLPGIVAGAKRDRADALAAYSAVHLEEEIRREAMVRDWGAFVRFLQFAAQEAGNLLNFAGISQETGISQPTVKTYYQLLEDMFIGFRVPAFSRSQRKYILSTPKFLFFDTGVRNAAAGLRPSVDIVRANPGPLFEQWVGIELWKRLQYVGGGALYTQKTQDGAEVDFIVERDRTLIPVEVKWTERPSLSDARHLLAFMAEHPAAAPRGWIVCRCARPLQVHEKVTAIPWQLL